MVFRFLRMCCKLVQRRTYSCLSTRMGIWFCVGGLILIAISTLQFGEMLIEFSMQKYTSNCQVDCDNIGRKSYKYRLCLPSPIDLVYTWVNGSDPILIHELKKLKLKLMQELHENVTNSYQKQVQIETELTNFRLTKGSNNTYHNFLPFNAIVIFDLPKNVTEIQLKNQNQLLKDSHFFGYKHNIDVGMKIIKFNNKKSYEEVVLSNVVFNGEAKHFERVFITSATGDGFDTLKNVKILKNLSYGITSDSIQESLALMNIINADVEVINHTSLITFTNYSKDRIYLEQHNNVVVIRGEKLKLLPTMLVWGSLKFSSLDLQLLNEDASSSRFADNDELKYSLRSVDKYAPWVRNIYIVTNGQIPSWLNLDHPRVKIVTHKELFLNKSHLPTYSSPSIETHIHRINGLSEKFIYMNDDVFFGDYVWPDDFYTHAKGQKIYLTWPVPNCNEGCPASWVNDKYCDKPCNVSECDWDGGDCLNTNGKVGWIISSSSLQGKSYNMMGQYCNSGCANSWIGDRYCDVNCNVKNCGFDAGDCGINNFNQLFSMDINAATIHEVVPTGVTTFYFNFTKFLNDGFITEGNYNENGVIRTAVFSRKYKTLTVSLYTNQTDLLTFKINGFKDANKTITFEYCLNISVDTTQREFLTEATRIPISRKPMVQGTIPSTNKMPFSLYDIAKKETRRLYKVNHTAQNRSNMTNDEGFNKTFHILEQIPKYLPASIWLKLNKTDQEFGNGDITYIGYRKRRFRILKRYFLGMNKTNTGLKEHANAQIHLHKFQRHLTSIDDENPIHYDKESIASNGKKWQNNKRHLENIVHANNRNRWMLPGYMSPVIQSYYPGPFRWEKQGIFTNYAFRKQRLKTRRDYVSEKVPVRVLLDTFASSLLHVSKIYNRAFSYTARKVPAHMPHMLDVNVINEMQRRFWPHFDETSSHKIRSPNDMQFAFSYFYYLMGVTATFNISQIFSELDTDESETLSDGELRTLAARLFPLPLEAGNFRSLHLMLKNCSLDKNDSETSSMESSSLPVVTREFLSSCEQIKATFKEQMKKKTKYRYEIVGDEDVTFKMLRNNISNLVFQLDWVRKNKRKFVCLNDNIDHVHNQARKIRILLKDFYESLFPKQSQFELPKRHRNRFLTVDELNAWKNNARKRAKNHLLYVYCAVVIVAVFIFRRKLYRLYKKYIISFYRDHKHSRDSGEMRREIIRI